MNIKFKKLLKTKNFFVGLCLYFSFSTIEGASESSAVEEATQFISFTPAFTRIAPKEFDETAEAMYICLRDRKDPEEATKALKMFNETHTNLDHLDANGREYIQNVSEANKAIYKFVASLAALESKKDEKLSGAIKARRALVLAVAHCIFDYKAADLHWKATRMWNTSVNYLYGNSCVKNIIVDSTKGMIAKVKVDKQPPEITEEEQACATVSDFSELCTATKTFLQELQAATKVTDLLKSSKRITYIPSKIKEHKE